MVFHFKRRTVIIASVVCAGLCAAAAIIAAICGANAHGGAALQNSPAMSAQGPAVSEAGAAAEENQPAIQYAEFNVPYSALEKALDIDIQSHRENKAVKISWIDLLSYLGAKYGGDFSKYKSTHMDALAGRLQAGETMETLTAGMTYYDYYSRVYTAVLGGMTGSYHIETVQENGETVWQERYGLTAFSPIAKNYPFTHYDDFGAQRTYGYNRRHLGHDYMAQTGTPVIAVESGIVEAVGWNEYGGWRLGIRSLDGSRYYYYAHLRQNRPYAQGMEEGKVVKAGDVIGYVGHTGYSTTENVNNIREPHLHLGLQLIFDKSQKDGANEIWIDLYALSMLWEKQKSEVYREAETKEHYRKYQIRLPGIQD